MKEHLNIQAARGCLTLLAVACLGACSISDQTQTDMQSQRVASEVAAAHQEAADTIASAAGVAQARDKAGSTAPAASAPAAQ